MQLLLCILQVGESIAGNELYMKSSDSKAMLFWILFELVN